MVAFYLSEQVFMIIMILKVVKSWFMLFQITHLHQKEIVFGKLTNITFAYPLSLVILQHFKEILRADH